MNSEQKRQIRSFVRREGRITRGQQQALDVLWPLYGIELNDRPLDLNNVFAQQGPCVLEIGFGNGETLAQMAVENPALNFLGLEVHRPGIGHLLHLIAAGQLTNIRIINADAVQVIETFLSGCRFVQISIFFPDPWPKKRHHKRRIIQSGFITLLAPSLSENGILHITTDWEDYAGHIDQLMRQQPGFKPATADEALPRPVTKFEQRGLSRGHAVYDLVYRKSLK